MLSTNAVAFVIPGELEVPGRQLSPARWNRYRLPRHRDGRATNGRAFLTLLAYLALLAVPAVLSFTRRDVGESQHNGPVTSTVVLLHSPLTTAAVGSAPRPAATASATMSSSQVDEDRATPYAARYVASVARFLLSTVDGPYVLVGHSGAGPLLPQVGFARHAALAPVAGYVFLDAMLPPCPGRRRGSSCSTSRRCRRAPARGAAAVGWSVPGRAADQLDGRGARPRGYELR